VSVFWNILRVNKWSVEQKLQRTTHTTVFGRRLYTEGVC